MITSLVIVCFLCWHRSGWISALMYFFSKQSSWYCHIDSKKLVDCRVAFTPKWRKRRAAAGYWCCNETFYWLSLLVKISSWSKVKKELRKITLDLSHPSQLLFELLPSGQSYRHWAPEQLGTKKVSSPRRFTSWTVKCSPHCAMITTCKTTYIYLKIPYLFIFNSLFIVFILFVYSTPVHIHLSVLFMYIHICVLLNLSLLFILLFVYSCCLCALKAGSYTICKIGKCK